MVGIRGRGMKRRRGGDRVLTESRNETREERAVGESRRRESKSADVARLKGEEGEG